MLKADEQITLFNCSSNYSMSTWTFEDGQKTSENSPTYKFTSEGVHDVLLTVSNGTEQSTLLKKFAVNRSSSFTLLIKFGPWKYPVGYASVNIEGLLEREETGSIHNYAGVKKTTQNDTLKYSDFKFSMTDDLSTYRVKLYFYGVTEFTTDKLDSIIINSIHAVDGRQDSTGVAYLKMARVDYTVQTLSFY